MVPRTLLRPCARGRSNISSATPIFDTFLLATKLERSGLTNHQTAAVVQCLAGVMERSFNDIENTTVKLNEQDKVNSQSKIDFAQLKSEIHLLERNDFAALKAENERMAAEVAKLQQKVREDINRTIAGNRLDLNLEKGKLWDEQSQLTADLREAEAKIEQEMNQLRASLQQVKFDTIRTLLTTASTLGLIVLGYMRLFK